MMSSSVHFLRSGLIVSKPSVKLSPCTNYCHSLDPSIELSSIFLGFLPARSLYFRALEYSGNRVRFRCWNVVVANLDVLSAKDCRRAPSVRCRALNSRIGRCIGGAAEGVTLRASAAETAEIEEDEQEFNSSAAKVKAPCKIKASGQLARWARARKFRSAGKTSLQSRSEVAVETASTTDEELVEAAELAKYAEPDLPEDRDLYGSGPPADDDFIEEKCIFMVSDGTGWTADHSVQAALGQFEHCLVDRRCSVDTHLFSDVNEEKLMEIIRQAGHEGAMVVFTLADPVMAASAKQACELLRVPHIDILGPITEAIGTHLGVTPLGLPRGAPGRKSPLSKQYFKRIEAVEFTIKQDDGALPKNLSLADIVLVGVSRTSKTPLSTYMAQKGYKVANVPLVLGIDPPKELFQIDQKKIFGLTINANFLKAIRLERYRHLGVSEESRSTYSEMEHIRKELEYSRKLFAQNPRWPVVEVTGKAIEETAAVILRLYHERRNKFSMPRISSRY